MAITNIVALVSWQMFWYGAKGEVISVIGFVIFAVNFIQMIGLFIVAQMRIFGEPSSLCLTD